MQLRGGNINISKKLGIALILTILTLSIGAVSATDADTQVSDDIGISSLASQDLNQGDADMQVNDDIGISDLASQDLNQADEVIQEDTNAEESADILSSSNDEEVLRGDMGISVVGGQKETYTVGEEVYLKLGTEQSSYTPANIYVQVQGGGYTDNPVGTYSEASSETGVPYTFDTPGDISLRFVQVYYGTYYFSDYITFNVVEAGPSIIPGTFTDLQSLIDSSEGVLELPYDFAYDSEHDSAYVDGILVSKNITINGMGHVISGENAAKIFDVWKADVVISNVTLANGRSNNGGAIIVSNGITSLLLKDSVIKDSSSNQGGAIHVMSGALTVENTTFINNSAKSGGAIYHNAGSSTLNVKNSTFEANEATSSGTAGGGGAIHMNAGQLNVENTDFNDNTAASTGGAINVVNFANVINVSGSRFNRNSGNDGGAIHAKLTSCAMSINDSNFTENSANGQGGAVYLQGAGVTSAIDNVKFANNSASDGGAISNKLGSSTIEKSSFEDNSASNKGGAIFASGKVAVNESSFAGNQAISDCNVHQIVDNVISVENTKIAVQAPDFDVKESYENGEDIVISGTFESGITNQELALPYSLNENNGSAAVVKKVFSIDLGSALKYGDYIISIKEFTDEAGNTYIFEDVIKAFTVKREVKTASDLQALIDNAEEGAVIELGNHSYENVSNVNITKNVTIKGSEDTTVSSAGDGTPIFNVPAKSENGPSGFAIVDVNFLVKNGDTVVKVTADNASDKDSIDNAEIKVINNTFKKENDDVVGKSITVVELESERSNLAPTNAIDISGNKMDEGIKSFQFEISGLSQGDDFNAPSIYDNPSYGTDERIPSIITCPAKTVTAIDAKVDGKKGAYYKLTLKDKDGSPLANKSVKVIIGNLVYTVKTDDKGIAKVQLNIKKAGTYKLFATFLGDDKYKGSFSSAKVKVNKQKIKMSVAKKTFKLKAKKNVKVTLKTSRGKAIKGKKITLKVKGKTYTAKTNKKGVATFKLILKKRGTFKATIKVPTDSTYKKLSKKIKIKIK